MKLSIRILFLLALGAFQYGCGQQTGENGASGPCAPNVIDSGLQLQVTDLGSNSYGFRLCADANSATPSGQLVYSVYGGISKDEVTPGIVNAANARDPHHFTGSATAGSVFQVSFYSTDNAFAIYQDTIDGLGRPQLDQKMILVQPHELPGR